jgi:hypothetical protein
MAKNGSKNDFSTMDTPYQTQPPSGSAEGPINYGKASGIAGDAFRDPMGVLPSEAKQHNIGPGGGEG